MLQIAASKLHILSVLLLVIIHYNAEKKAYKDFETIWFLKYLKMLMATLLVDEVTILLEMGSLTFLDQTKALYVMKGLFFVLFGFAIYMWIIFSESVEDVENVSTLNKRKAYLIPFVVCAIVNIFNYHSHWMYTVKNHMIADHHGLFYTMILFFVGTLTAEALRKEYFASYEPDPAKQKKSYLMADFAYPSVAFIIIGAFMGGEPLSSVGMTFATVFVYLGMLEEGLSVDPLTRVNNRQQLSIYLREKMKRHEGHLYLLMMDLDYFKIINDKYGHVEGDKALIRVTDALKKCCKHMENRAFISRYGGDEFTVVAELPGPDELDALIKDIQREVRVTNKWENAEYELTVSIGAADYDDPNIVSAKDLIDAADNKLYIAKAARKKHVE